MPVWEVQEFEHHLVRRRHQILLPSHDGGREEHCVIATCECGSRRYHDLGWDDDDCEWWRRWPIGSVVLLDWQLLRL